jgi:predicted transcriptional regulator
MHALSSPLAMMLDPFERDILQILWERGPQTTRQLLTALRNGRPMAYLTMTAALERLCERGVLDRHREPCPLTRSTWRYTPTFTRQALLLQAGEQLCAQLGEDRGDRSLALAALLGAPRSAH